MFHLGAVHYNGGAIDGICLMRTTGPLFRLRHVLILGLALAAGAILLSTAGAESITVNGGVRYQTMTGWEGITRGWEIDKVANAYDPSFQANAGVVADKLVNDLGVDRIAMPLSSGWANGVDYWSQFVSHQLTYSQWSSHAHEKTDPNLHQVSEFDFYADTVLVPMRQRLAARGEKLYVNMIFGDYDKTPSAFQFSANPAAYAAFVQFYVDRLKNKYGVVVDAFTIINEPDNTATWGSVQIGNALAAVKSRLDAAGYPDINYIAPSVLAASNAIPYANGMASVAGAMSALKTLSYHRYQPGDYAAIRNYALSRNLQTDMSEYINATVDTLLDDLTLANVSSWQKWALATRNSSNPQAYYYTATLPGSGGATLAYAPSTAALAQFFRYVRLGAVRVDAQSTTMKTVAFVNANGNYVLVVRRTPGSGSGSVAVGGLKAGSYGVRTTNANGVAVRPGRRDGGRHRQRHRDPSRGLHHAVRQDVVGAGGRGSGRIPPRRVGSLFHYRHRG